MKKSKHVVAPTTDHVPTSIMATLLQAVAELGHDTDALLADAGAGCTTRELLTGTARPVSMASFTSINQRCNAILRDHIRLHHDCVSMNDDQFNMFCRCVIHAATLEQAIEITRQFFDMFEGRIGKVTLEVSGDRVSLHINRQRHAINNACFLVHIYGFAVLHRLYSWLIDERIELLSTQLIYPAPASNLLLIGLFDHDIHFLQASNAFSFSRSYLDRPVVRTAQELHQLSGLFPYDLMLSYRGKPLAERIYQVMIDHYSSTRRLPEIGHISRLFHMTDHTMRRRLNEENTAYSKIKQQCQLNIITDYLRRPDLTINEIAERSGFSDASTFRRAFKQWTGKSPSAYRHAEAPA